MSTGEGPADPDMATVLGSPAKVGRLLCVPWLWRGACDVVVCEIGHGLGHINLTYSSLKIKERLLVKHGDLAHTWISVPS